MSDKQAAETVFNIYLVRRQDARVFMEDSKRGDRVARLILEGVSRAL